MPQSSPFCAKCQLPIVSEQEGVFNASKWQHLQALVSQDELERLFQMMGSFTLYSLGTPLPSTDIPIPQEEFLTTYGTIIASLQEGRVPTRTLLRKILPCVLSSDKESLYLMQLADGRCLIKMRRPVLQIQAHFFRYSPLDTSFRSMVMGEDVIFWGLQFSYPQIFQDPNTLEVQKEKISEGHFAHVRKWAREETRATPFLLENGVCTNVPIRLGKSCFSWISAHPELKKHGIQVEAAHEN